MAVVAVAVAAAAAAVADDVNCRLPPFGEENSELTFSSFPKPNKLSSSASSNARRSSNPLITLFALSNSYIRLAGMVIGFNVFLLKRKSPGPSPHLPGPSIQTG
ncbi:hypothetical protein BLOT_016525 [Blomia tropicalis]|nr:hypothetical protein BLOT_016525 [Blomia tropicalis]